MVMMIIRILLAMPFSLALVACGSGGVGGDGGGGSSPPMVTLQSIAVTPANLSIPVGLTRQFTTKGLYSDGTSHDITTSATWTSGTTSVATISASGLAATIMAGSSVITAILGSISASTTLTVNSATLQS